MRRVGPLLTGDVAERARAAVADIAAALLDPATFDTDPGLHAPDVGRGAAGVAVFLHAYGDSEGALSYLDSALERAADDPPSALLYVGTVGVGWALEVVEGHDDETNDVDGLVDRALGVAWPSADLIRGITGAGVYLAERRRPLAAAVATLASCATETPQGTTWFVEPATLLPDRREMFPEGYFDVGMAHGQAGMVTFLAHALAAGEETARPLLESSVAWLLAQRLPEGGYPHIVADGRDPKPGRLAWCYGDPGVAVGLLAAGRALNDTPTMDEAVALALLCAGRTGDPSVVDAPLCHGAAGLAHVFNRLHQQTGEERLATAARYWAEDALARRVPGRPVAGFGSVRPDENDVMTYEPLGGFLEGAAGIGLALLSATSADLPDWDAVLLTKPVPE